ncbi:MAG: glycine cleavage system aminomethyltransferase GcvT [Candidatus Scalindua sp. AMX11]|nr:MAG: glycine cleavage system aminomethyltransferase GcvT [Candidatus Scalindua sp.]NOG86108.1 glycine cleavage system aminomethyltransferase GcvT [Planctomycetota bacterium]RZV98875.1 MAG: glycine cleavage system aminomethyltransferase GcvT [Candidatus Scalindua sp. SCAELEC01]TDE66933.1 MAG: glycine cleavage system aminomethyltransferase GcvT [Candidatus Scalindua sp. AMX11]GJQ57740.1 MAG: aminomethyltransferase [Candidatus Scalindua sp.]
MSNKVKKTPLYGIHVELGAHITDFSHFLMPVQYDTIIGEHRSTRNSAGLFDISHMGEIVVAGKGATDLIQHIITNDVGNIKDHRALYTPICNKSGGIIDDVIVLKFHPEKYMVVANCVNTKKDNDWIHKWKTNDTTIEDVSDQVALLAVQGPKSESIIRETFEEMNTPISRFQFAEITDKEIELTISRTGYTGEDGFEIFVNHQHSEQIWNRLLEKGSTMGLKPAGLGARDTLRLEAGLPLYGNEIDDTTTPLEANIGWTVKFYKGNFIGKDSLLRQRTSGVKKKLIAFKMHDKGIPRTDNEIIHHHNVIGKVTSGTFSPTLNIGIGLGYVLKDFAQPKSQVNIKIRGKEYAARIVHTPFVTSDLNG